MGVLNEIVQLELVGCVDIQTYTLVSNYGYTFSKGGVKYDLRYWENYYGVYGGGWHVSTSHHPIDCPYFGDDFDAVIDWIEENL